MGSDERFWVTAYYIGAVVIAALAFVGTWIYAVMSWGFLLGIGFGWIPAAIFAALVGLTWPLLVVVGFWVGVYLLHLSS